MLCSMYIVFFQETVQNMMTDSSQVLENTNPENKHSRHIQVYAELVPQKSKQCCKNSVGNKTGQQYQAIESIFIDTADTAQCLVQCRQYGNG